MIKQLTLSFLSLLLITIAGVSVIGGLAVHHVLSASNTTEEKLVLIKRGSGISSIAETLKQEGIISQPLLFKVISRFKSSLKAGEYAFPAQVSMIEAISMLEQGLVFDRKITIIEGLTSHQIVKRLNNRNDLTGDKITTLPAEGSLLPDTYSFTSADTRENIQQRMQHAMEKTLEKAWEKRQRDLPLKTKQEALVLASIIEKETSVPHERKKVAGVFINRLRLGMALQTDPTVIYAITKGNIKENGKGPLGRRLLKKDLTVNSPYNTYKHAGLPPGPIANPGKDSIEASLNPEDHDYIFFVADGTGGHAFAKTLKEHNRNVAKWRKVRKNQ